MALKTQLMEIMLLVQMEPCCLDRKDISGQNFGRYQRLCDTSTCHLTVGILFDVGDLAELHYSIDNGNQWQLLDNWSGNTSDWTSENYSLDSLIQGSSTIGFRFYVKKLNQSIATEGLFIDSFNLSNQGDPLAAWFHGGMLVENIHRMQMVL